MSYKIAGIDIHKRVLMVVVASVADAVADATGAAMEFECRRFGTGASERQHLVAWLQEHQVREVVRESTAQYWKPVWLDLEPHFEKLHLAQAQSNRAPKGRKNDFSGCQAPGTAPVGRRTDAELCAGAGTADMATHDPRATATGARTGALTEPGRVSAGGSADQAVERDQRFAGRQRAADSGGAQQRGNRCGEVGRAGRRPAEVHERAISRRPARRTGARPSATSETASGTFAIAGRADRAAQPDECLRADELSGCRGAAGRSAWIRLRVVAADGRRSGGGRRGVPLGGRVRLLGGSLSRQ